MAKRLAKWSLAVIGVVIAAVPLLYALDRGIYLGSTDAVLTGSWLDGPMALKTCHYLFVTGIAEKPAHEAQNKTDQLYCRFFGE